MTYKENNYISKLLNDSSELHDINVLRGFLKNLDIKRIEEQLDNEIALSTSFSDRNLYQRYPKYEKHWLTYVTILKDIILSGEENLSRVAKKVQDSFQKQTCYISSLKPHQFTTTSVLSNWDTSWPDLQKLGKSFRYVILFFPVCSS